MKHLTILGIILLLLSLVSCGGKTPIPTGPLPTHTEQMADDIIPTPGGGAYRASVHEAGKENPWPPVQTGIIYWTKGVDTITVFHRTDIEAKAGEAYTDIISVGGKGMMTWEKNTLILYAGEIPKGITVTDTAKPVGLIGTLGTVLVITVSPDIAPGMYTVNIGIELDGKDYGTVPCRVKVVE
jgi:hypothetical protein